MRNGFTLAGAALSACFVFTPAMAEGQANANAVKMASLETGKVEAVNVAAPKAENKAGKKAAKKVRKRVHTRLVAKINLSSQRLTVLVDGKVKHVWKISTGRSGHHTPRGVYKPYSLQRMHYSRKYNNAAMPHSVFFRGGFAIHATGAIGRLGTPASHGCVRLHPSNARAFYNLVSRYKKAGTVIRISGSTPASHYRRRVARKKQRRNSFSWGSSYSSRYTSSQRRSRRSYRRASNSGLFSTWW